MSFNSWTSQKVQTPAPLVNNRLQYYDSHYENCVLERGQQPREKKKKNIVFCSSSDVVFAHTVISHKTSFNIFHFTYKAKYAAKRVALYIADAMRSWGQADQGRLEASWWRRGWNIEPKMDGSMNWRGGEADSHVCTKRIKKDTSIEHEVNSFFLWFMQYVATPCTSETVFFSLLSGGN